MRTPHWLPWLCGGLLLFWAACDSAPGPEPLDQRPPTLSEFSFSPHNIILEQLPPEQIEGEEIVIPLDLSIVAKAPSGTIGEVSYVVQSPLSTLEPLATGTLSAAGGSRYTATETIRIPQAEVGTYTVLVYAVDSNRRLSGESRGSIKYVASGQPPVIEAVEAPDTIARPGPGEPDKTLQIVAVVSDPDGLNNILRVEFWNATAPNQKVLLCDDGGGQPCGPSSDSGDEVANDGRFTQTVFLTANNAPGTNTFIFQATDRSGLVSETVEKQITVE